MVSKVEPLACVQSFLKMSSAIKKMGIFLANVAVSAVIIAKSQRNHFHKIFNFTNSLHCSF